MELCNRNTKKTQEELSVLTASVVPELRQYIPLWRPINDLTDKHRDDIAEISKGYYEAATALQVYQNKAEETSDKINAASNKDGSPKIDINKQYQEGIVKANEIANQQIIISETALS